MKLGVSKEIFKKKREEINSDESGEDEQEERKEVHSSDEEMQSEGEQGESEIDEVMSDDETKVIKDQGERINQLFSQNIPSLTKDVPPLSSLSSILKSL